MKFCEIDPNCQAKAYLEIQENDDTWWMDADIWNKSGTINKRLFRKYFEQALAGDEEKYQILVKMMFDLMGN